MTLLNKISVIVLGGAVLGAVMTGIVLFFVLSVAGVPSDRAMNVSIPYTLIIGTSFLIPVLMIRILIDRLILQKVRHMSEVINRISKGEIDTRVEIRSDDEIGRMAEAFERMRASLKLLISKVGRK